MNKHELEKNNENINFLKNIELFLSLSHKEINNFINCFKYKEIEKDKIIFNQGETGNELFIVKYGKISSLINTKDNSRHEIANFSSGEFFGEMSIFDKSPRSATCIAKEKSLLLSLHEKDFNKIIESYPEIAIKIMHKMLYITKKRLTNTNVFLSDMVTWGENARKRSITDSLSGIYNRRFLEDSLPELFEKVKKNGESINLIMIDMDEFREINSKYGTETGDNAIIEVVKVFKKFFRKDDIIGRYGGDEFMIIVPNSPLMEVKKRALMISKEVNKLEIFNDKTKKTFKVTISIGVGNYPKNANSLEKLKILTDKALYKAKESGKNKIVFASTK